MSDLQLIAVQWLTVLVTFLPVGYAFGAGMVAAVNPCGFAMLPAYLSLYLGVQDRSQDERSAVFRIASALLVGASVSTGFLSLFAVAGLVISAGGHFLVDISPWLGAVIGIGLIGLGVLLLTGRTLSPAIFEQLADRMGKPGERSMRGFFLFGLTYGLASLSCTMPIFLVVVGSALAGGSLVGGLVQFVSYGLGMATVIVTLTVALGLFKAGLVGQLRRVLPYVQTAAALLLVVAGVSIVLYWSPYVLNAVQG